MDKINEILNGLNAGGRSIGKEPAPKQAVEIIEDNSFSYHDYQVTRGELFAHIHEPSISFNQNKIYVNSTCIRKLPDIDYILFLVNPKKKTLVLRPSTEEERHSIRWCSAGAKRSPKKITCKVFCAKVFDLMGWNPIHRYKLLGKMIRSNNELLFVFDLNSSEVYQRIITDGQGEHTSRKPLYPEEWKDSFGVPYDEHQRQLKINIFDGYAVFSMGGAEEASTLPHDGREEPAST